MSRGIEARRHRGIEGIDAYKRHRGIEAQRDKSKDA